MSLLVISSHGDMFRASCAPHSIWVLNMLALGFGATSSNMETSANVYDNVYFALFIFEKIFLVDIPETHF